MATDAQIQANIANAQYSSGPKTAEGKAASSQNALKFTIDGKLIHISEEEKELETALSFDYTRKYKPADYDELCLLNTLVRSDLLMRRYDVIEAITIRNAMDPALPFEEALTKVYTDAAAKHTHPLAKIQKLAAAAQRNWFRAMSQLTRAQKTRKAEERAAAANKPKPEATKTNPISGDSPTPAPSTQPPTAAPKVENVIK